MRSVFFCTHDRADATDRADTTDRADATDRADVIFYLSVQHALSLTAGEAFSGRTSCPLTAPIARHGAGVSHGTPTKQMDNILTERSKIKNC